MKRIIILIFISILLSCNRQVDDKAFQNKSEIEINTNEITSFGYHSKKVILYSLIALNEYNFIIPDTIDITSLINNGYHVDELLPSYEHIYSNLNEYLENLVESERIKIINRIDNWCCVYEVFNFIFSMYILDSNDFIEFGEVVEDVDEIKAVLNKYILVEGQNYYSLSGSQINMFIMDLVTYISSLPPKDQKNIIEKIMKKMG